MLAMTILLLAAAPATHHVRPVHHGHAVYHGRVARKPHRSFAMTSRKLQVATVATTPARSPYRLPLDLPDGPTAKDIALNEDGSRCAVIGQTICPRPTRTLIRVGEDSPVKMPAKALR